MRLSLVHKRIPFNLHSFFFSSGDREAICEVATGWMYFFSTTESQLPCSTIKRTKGSESRRVLQYSESTAVFLEWANELEGGGNAEEGTHLGKVHSLSLWMECPVRSWSQYHMESTSKIIPVIICCSIQIYVFGGTERKSKEVVPPACILPSSLPFLLLLLCSSPDLILYNIYNIHELTEVWLIFCTTSSAWQMT